MTIVQIGESTKDEAIPPLPYHPHWLRMEPWVIDDETVIRAHTPEDLSVIKAWTPAESQPFLHIHPTIVAEVRGTVVGYGQYLVSATVFFHLALRIADEWQRFGLGRRLMDYRIALAREIHCAHHYAIVLKSKPAMMALCEKVGMSAYYEDAQTITYQGRTA